MTNTPKDRKELTKLIAGHIDSGIYMEGPSPHAIRKAENILETLHASGLRIVPVEMSGDMWRASIPCSGVGGVLDEQWSGMLNASPYAPEE